jgi:hypothetical protein
MNELLGLCIPFAQETIEQHGEFHPFGAALSVDGRPQLAGAAVEFELPDAGELIIRLNEAFQARARAGEIRACAVCADVRLDDDRAAIRIDVEHRDARPMLFLVPYRRRLLRGYLFEPLSASPGRATVFGDREAD